MQNWVSLFKEHVQTLQHVYEELISEQKVDGILIHAGSTITRYLDDQDYEFWTDMRFRQWIPERVMNGSLLLIRPEQKPLLFWHHPIDFWHAVVEPPSGFWTECFDIKIVKSPDEISSLLPKEEMIGLGQDERVLKELGAICCNPARVCHRLDWQRSIKTDYEIACIQEANHTAVKGHMAAKKAFLNGDSELDIHLKYLSAVREKEALMPYANIVALNENTSVLHYHNYQTTVDNARSFLIDAGASHYNYAADITRTYVKNSCLFGELIDRIDDEVQYIIRRIKPGVSYPDLHNYMHQRMSEVLVDFSIVNLSATETYEKGYTRIFFPHGLGHFLGLAVHDSAGKQAGMEGGQLSPDERYPALRCLRTLEQGMVVTIEPGLYFIPSLLESVKSNPDFNWKLINELKSFGGIRIEDNILVKKEGAFNFTRTAFKKVNN